MYDLLQKEKLGPAYWMPLPLSYMTATGTIAAQWGYFEMQFSGFIQILARPPELAPLAAKISRNFSDKAELLRKLARRAFPSCPTLTEKLCDFSIRANEAGKKRNAIIHGFWFDMTPFEPAQSVTLTTEPDGTGDFYTVTLEALETLARKISDLKMEGIELTFMPFHAPPARLTQDEYNTLLEYHKNFPAPAQVVPILRHPSRKGSPKQPEPFRP